MTVLLVIVDIVTVTERTVATADTGDGCDNNNARHSGTNGNHITNKNNEIHTAISLLTESDMFCRIFKIGFGKGDKNPVTDSTSFFKPRTLADGTVTYTSGIVQSSEIHRKLFHFSFSFFIFIFYFRFMQIILLLSSRELTLL